MPSSQPLNIDPSELISRFNSSAKISQYLDLLENENRKINLVSRETDTPGLLKLAAESLIPFEIISQKQFRNYLDIGSGGGFPSFPIMLSLEIENSVLIERTKKKATALVSFSESLNLNARILDQNLEECQLDQEFDLITLRLVRLAKPLFGKIEELLSSNGKFIYYAHFDKSLKKTKLNFSSYSYTTGDDSPIKSFTIFSR